MQSTNPKLLGHDIKTALRSFTDAKCKQQKRTRAEVIERNYSMGLAFLFKFGSFNQSITAKNSGDNEPEKIKEQGLQHRMTDFFRPR